MLSPMKNTRKSLPLTQEKLARRRKNSRRDHENTRQHHWSEEA